MIVDDVPMTNENQPKPSNSQVARCIGSLTAALTEAGGCSRVIETVLNADDSFDELITICALNQIEFVYKGKAMHRAQC